MKSSTKKIAKFGLAAKGLIYLISGILTLLAALNMGGAMSGKFRVLDFLQKQPLGNVLLVILALGLISYSIWRFIQSFNDPEDNGNDAKGVIKRIGFAVSAIIYLVIAGIAIKKVFFSSGGSGSQNYVDKFGPTTITIAFIIIGLAMAGKAIFHFKKAVDKKFLKEFSIDDLKFHKLAKYAGYLGYYARAIVIGIVAFFFLKAGLYSGNNEIKGTKEAFSFLQESSYGTILMGLVAAGLASYGIFVLLLSKYKRFDD
ncbi:DUF1206 domain-containing protein [Mesonia aestuariivivens]|uniref:DUF1206 domain-containing protein n=1 Tax=Mesonia aestuariivivens TaxID=2796128 RepID=A0ABS6W0Q6_9FLAO|nr:DUF1206 domain-containing protein [Mesonia aestuariivivens]MBW2960733.1 DUF1206 domain-containing protein [Mesonia aestuariivivens]